MKKLLVLACCMHDNADPIFRLRSSCEKLGLDFKYYGVKEIFVSWKQAKIDRLSQILKEYIGQYEYTLVSDGFDTFMLQEEEQIIATFNKFNSKLVVSSEIDCSPIQELKDHYPPCTTRFRFVNGGQFMGKTEDLAEIIGTMAHCYENKVPQNRKGNDQIHWTYAYLEGKLGVTLDTECKLFLSMNGLTEDEINFSGKHLELRDNLEAPCAIHFNGPKGGTPNGLLMDKIYNKFINL